MSAAGESVEVRLARQEERVIAAEKATQVAFAALEAWKVSANEWRQALNDQRADFVTRREIDVTEKRVNVLEVARGEQMGKAAAYASIAGFIGVVAAIVGHYWH
jgi:O6-methylguanine-DNA--protein-cysteine methyltransferase